MIVSCSIGYSQDSAYYYTAFNSSGDSLKGLLHDIIKNHTEFPYSSSSTDTWDILKETDRDPNNSNNVILIYSNRSVDGPQEFNNGNGWNREHVWPRSRGDFGTGMGVGTDVHHLRPCDIEVNATRENRNFDNCMNCQDVIDGGFNTGSKTDANQYTFQPPDNVKGDIARMIFYMAVRYEGDNGELDLELTNTLQTNTQKDPVHAVLNTLLEWNREDSVDSFEQNRNQVIYSYQGNKNPFIDYPELAEYLWGDSLGLIWMAPPDTVQDTVNVGLNEQLNTSIRIYPNPNSGDIVQIKSQEKLISVIIYDQLGRVMDIYHPDLKTIKINTSNYHEGIYLVSIITDTRRSFKRLIIH